ncbi:putative fatty acid elongation protein 3 isoform X2 [Folsomia candida]|nr:putative fatty acid elongation protein 3 isoform X2 [Folsomia candida]
MQNWQLPFYVCIIYLLVIFQLENYMRTRKPLKLQKPLVLWNLVLAVFSLVGTFRIVPEMLKIVQSPGGFHVSVCNREGLNAPTAIWGVLFVLSKLVELGDSVFIVLRKQPLIFLHWYHHSVALILAFEVFPYGEPIGRYYALMNYAVHSVMYSYYALKAMKVQISRKLSMVITSLQLLQMMVGVWVNFYTLYAIHVLSVPCARERQSVQLIAVIYGSFTFLFADFMYKAYFSSKKVKRS